jgi:hypothetical protein
MRQHPDRRKAWCRLAELYGEDRTAEQGDFSERLLILVDRIVARGSSMNVISSTAEVTKLVYGEDIRPLNDALSAYVVTGRKDAIWVLVDNLDKSWPV